MPPRHQTHLKWPRAQVPGDRMQRGIGEEIDRVLVSGMPNTFVDRLHRPPQSEISQSIRDCLSIRDGHRIYFAVEVKRRAPPKETGQQQCRKDKKDGVAKRKAHRGRAPQPTHASRVYTRHLEWCAATVLQTRNQSFGATC